MPSGVSALRRISSSTRDAAWTPSLLGPPPSEQLLRTDGGGHPTGPAAIDLDEDPVARPASRPFPLPLSVAAAQLRADAVRVLGAADVDTASPRWRSPAFTRLVQRVRSQLAPLDDAGLLAIAFAHEAFHLPTSARVPAIWDSPARVAYAIHWIELEAGIELPHWARWFA